VRKSRKDDSWRDELYTDPFQCACGCELQLSKGDMMDATLVLARLGGNPRTWGVDISPKSSPRAARQEPPDPVVGRPCSKCGDMVYLPDYAAAMLDERKCFWPLCGDCRKPKPQADRQANQYWE
jgi:hypothetical protein